MTVGGTLAQVPSTVASVFAAAGLEPAGCVRWGDPLPGESGIYVVSLTASAKSGRAAVAECPTSMPAIRAWLERRPEMLLDGTTPTPKRLATRMATLWLADEVVLYVGIASGTLEGRVGGYYSTPLGNRSPHAGGRYLKTLSVLEDLHIHYAFHPGPKEKLERMEAEMLGSFTDHVSKATRAQLRDPEHPLPFANVNWEPLDPLTGKVMRRRKDHGLKLDVPRQVRRPK